MQSSVKNEEEDSRSGQKDWDEIIPEADRKTIEEEERKKQEAELYLPPRNRKSLLKVCHLFMCVILRI